MPNEQDKPVISLGSDFKFGAVDPIQSPAPQVKALGAVDPNAGLGLLEFLIGSWSGHGFNTIFRPLNGKSPIDKKTFPIPPTGDNVLELNLTSESITFTPIDGEIPNRGEVQADINLKGLTYLQQISDVTSGAPVGIHIEPGIWIVIPQATDPTAAATVTRMASIPHGTTINAQGTAFAALNGPPDIKPVSITPALVAPLPGQSGLRTFPSQTATAGGTARIPQDLSPFIAAETITQAMIDDPNTVLRNAIAHQKVVKTIPIVVSTGSVTPNSVPAGTTNIAFLQSNALAVQMTATFWLETVQQTVTIPVFKPGDPPVQVPLSPLGAGRIAPKLLVDPGRELTAPRQVTLEFKQIQYTQLVTLDFNGLRWPHVSVATLVPASTVVVPPTAWS